MKRHIITLAVMLSWAMTGPVYSDMQEAGIFEGRYHGQGRGCGGILTIRENSISWHSQALDCEMGSYEILKEEHNGYHHRAIYRFRFKNKTCPLAAIELNHDENFSSYMVGWQVAGFFRKEEYEDHQGPASASYVCALIKDYNPRNNPEPPLHAKAF